MIRTLAHPRLALSLALPLTLLASTSAWASPRVYADFDGDGYEDLAVPVPFEDVNGDNDAGAVQIIYGSSIGLTGAGNQLWYLDNVFPGGIGQINPDDGYDQFLFGHHVAAGDFNGDDYADLVVGVPTATLWEQQWGNDWTAVDAGAIVILYGSPYGLTNEDAEFITQSSINGDEPEDWDFFGSRLAVGDFDDDGYADIAAAAEYEDHIGCSDFERELLICTDHDSGAVQVLYGSPFGIGDGLSRSQTWTQDTNGIEGARETDDLFGSALAAADFDGDGDDDLAIGARGEDIGDHDDAGVIHIIPGSPNGLTASGSKFIHQNTPGADGGAEDGDQFGFSLAACDLSDNGAADLAVGIPYEDDGENDSGAVQVLYAPLHYDGDPAINDDWWSQSSPGVSGALEHNDHFGWELTCGDFDGDGGYDLAIGVPGEDLGDKDDAGGVVVLYNGDNRLGTPEFWSQDSSGVNGGAEDNDHFGARLGAGDFDGDGDDDLVVAVPDEDVDGVNNAGGIQVFDGSDMGVSTIDIWWDQNTSSLQGGNEAHDHIGGDYNESLCDAYDYNR